MRLEPNRCCNNSYSLWATEEELKLLNNLIKEARKTAPIKSPIEQFEEERRKEQRRNSTTTGRRHNVSERRAHTGTESHKDRRSWTERRK